MKRIFGMLLVIVFMLIYTNICFAETVNIPDPNAPGQAPAVTLDMYPEDVPQSAVIKDQNIPASGELVKTGGVPAELFYAAGGLCIVAALIIARKANKASTENK